jgi:hypothetical protein
MSKWTMHEPCGLQLIGLIKVVSVDPHTARGSLQVRECTDGDRSVALTKRQVLRLILALLLRTGACWV